MNDIVDRLWLNTREHIGDLLTQAEQSIGTMRTLVQRAESAADNAEQGAPAGGWPASDLGPHEHTQAQVIGLDTSLEGKADLVGGHVPTSQIPALALTKPFVVQDRAGMLALVAQEGDVAVIQEGDDQGTYMLGDGPSGVYESWVALASSVDVPVQSVNGQVGTIILGPGDVDAAPANHSHTLQALGAAPASHNHTIPQVDGLEDALNSKATTAYVNSRHAFFSGTGAPPTTITGAVAGDWWLDESNMELYKIEGI